MLSPSILPILLFPIFPFLSFLIACTNLKNKANGVIFVLFYALFGYCHSFEDIRADSYRKYINFQSYDIESISDIMQQFSDGEKMDIYESILFSWLRLWTDNPHIMMMFVGLIAGIFVLKIIRRILSDYSGKYDCAIYVIILMNFILLSFVHIGGIRNITALVVFTYSAIRFLIDRDNWWVIGIFAAPLIHFGYGILTIVALIARFVTINWKTLFWPTIFMCAASIILDTSDFSGIVGNMAELVDNESIVDRVEHYADDDTEAIFAKSLTTKMMSIQKVVSAIYMILILMFIKRNSKQLNWNSYIQYLLCVTMLFLLVGYSLFSFSVVGSRYLKFGLILFYLFVLNLYKLNPKVDDLRYYIYILPVVNGVNILWTIYNAYCNTGLDIYYQSLLALLL
uniref:EpsG family protein n=1 Tax=Alistipes sp. TaxID=1872444 RepID=UPI0040579B69